MADIQNLQSLNKPTHTPFPWMVYATSESDRSDVIAAQSLLAAGLMCQQTQSAI